MKKAIKKEIKMKKGKDSTKIYEVFSRVGWCWVEVSKEEYKREKRIDRRIRKTNTGTK